MKILLPLSDACIKYELVENGLDVSSPILLTLDPKSLHKDDRAALAEYTEKTNDVYSFHSCYWIECDGERIGHSMFRNPFKSPILPTTPQQWHEVLLEFVRVYEFDWKTIAQEELAERRAAEIRTAEAAEAAEATRRNQEGERAAAQAELSAWVSKHGSDYLQKAVGAGYDCKRVYATERAAMDHPGYDVLLAKDEIRMQDRACPSEKALDEALNSRGTVVWLPGENREAVVIRDYIGEFMLIKRIYKDANPRLRV